LNLCVLEPIEAYSLVGPIEFKRAKERTLLAAIALFHGRAVSTQRLVAALARWKGEPYADLGEWSPAELERRRIVELRDHAVETCLEFEIGTGPAAGCIGELESMVAENLCRSDGGFCR
jgi:hypothetical protein